MSPRSEPLARARQPRAADLRFDAQCDRWGIVATYATCHGQPRVDGTSVRVFELVERFLAGDSVAELGARFDLDVHQVENALRFHMAKDGLKAAWRDRQLAASAREGT